MVDGPTPGPGTVVGIYVASDARQLPRAVREVEIVAGRGLDGDRYGSGLGTFSKPGKSGQDLTLIEEEALDALRAEHGIELDGAASRRNVMTRGIDLDALVGLRFRVGELLCEGDRLCDPCAHLERLTEPGVLDGLAGRGGLRANVVTGGRLRVGDAIEAS